VEEVHDFHIWALSVGKLSMTAHIRAGDKDSTLRKINKILKETYGIYHSTIQLEGPSTQKHSCDNDHH